jgi:hypothetical protein
MLARGAKDKEHAMSQNLNNVIAVIGIDIGKNSFHVVSLDGRGNPSSLDRVSEAFVIVRGRVHHLAPWGARLLFRNGRTERLCARNSSTDLRRLVNPFLPERARRSASCGGYGGTDRSVNQLFRAKMLGNGRA